MTPFLKLVADDLYMRFNGRLEDIAVVFPNKRAGLFFSEYLLQNSGDKPMWSPRYMTINELFQQNSKLTIGDPIVLVSKLYKEYAATMEGSKKTTESLDNFYYWGEMLLKDFDDIDKHLADASQLFANLKELREIGIAKETLNREQAESIARFFKNFNIEEESEIKYSFSEMWEKLYRIYIGFKESLRCSNIAYEGMLYRDVIENHDDIILKHDKYVFVGFNALNDAETTLFEIIKKRGKALFYWDYDKYYIQSRHHEAGLFMRLNLERFPNELHEKNFDNLSLNKEITIVESSSDNMETRYISQWLDKNMTSNEIETAIVLCDETMLEPVLHTIPGSANGNKLEEVNVTMGFPLSHTPIFSFAKQFVELHTRGWSTKHNAYTLSAVSEILNNPYVVKCCPKSTALRQELLGNKTFFPTTEKLSQSNFLEKIFSNTNDNRTWFANLCSCIKDIALLYSQSDIEKMQMYEKLFCEAIYKVYTQGIRFSMLLDSSELDVNRSTLGRLFIKMLSMHSMPFHGEPVVGLQIMGLLETRNLDFKHVIILGANEGNIPKNLCESSYIPYNLRRAFGLTLSEHRDSIYAYYFYRLLQRAEKVTIVYNSSSESKTRGECSRYILQLLGSKLYKVNKIALTSQHNSRETSFGAVEKNAAMVKKLRKRFDTGFSNNASTMTPSAINKYIGCGLSFFYYYILGIRKPEEVNEELQSYDFGNIFHCAAQELYEKITQEGGNIITKEKLDYYIKNSALLYGFIDKAFKKEFFKNNRPEYNGEQFINRGVLHHFLLRLVKLDSGYAPFKYIGSEKEVSIPYTIRANGTEIELRLGGKIDRIDTKGDTINIIDYKTGYSSTETKTSLENIFAFETKSAANRLQAFLYSVVIEEMLCGNAPVHKEENWLQELKMHDTRKVSPSLLYIHNMENVKREEYTIDILKNPVTDISTIKKEYMEKLTTVIEEIFDVNTPFSPCDDKKRCEYCDYRKICGK